MIKKVVLFTLIIFVFYMWYFQPTLEQKFYTSIDKQCQKKENCSIYLHDVTPFKWDKAYFFERNSSEYIKNFKEITHNFQHDIGNKIIFIKNNKMIAYMIIDSEYDLKSSWQIPRELVDINFYLTKQDLQYLNYSGNFDIFQNFIIVNYYLITPQNDQLNINFYVDKINWWKQKQNKYVINVTNLNQVKLFNPKTDSN